MQQNGADEDLHADLVVVFGFTVGVKRSWFDWLTTNGKVQRLRNKGGLLQRTDVSDPAYFHKVVDCQWACPAHTPVPEYIRLIAQGRYSDAYMINWQSNVFPGILGRTCDRPCEPACRRGRVEESMGATPEPVAICRLKRVAADMKDDVRSRMPSIAPKNGKRVACIGAEPASLAAAGS